MSKKTKIIFGIPLVLLLIGGLALLGFFLFSTPAATEGSIIHPDQLVDGVFQGQFRSGPNRAEVEVTIRDRRVAEIKVLRNVASWIGKEADPAVPERIIALQSTTVDAVTGATHSSRVIMNAVEDAVRKSYALARQ